MDNHSNPRDHDAPAEKSTGCCGEKSEAKPQTKVAPTVAETVAEKPAKSGCCCGNN